MIIEINPKKSSIGTTRIRLDTDKIEYVYQLEYDNPVVFVVFSGGRKEWFEGVTIDEILPLMCKLRVDR